MMLFVLVLCIKVETRTEELSIKKVPLTVEVAIVVVEKRLSAVEEALVGSVRL